MVVVFDSSVLIDLFNPKLDDDRKIKIDMIIASLKQQRAKILIPTPVMTEVLIKSSSAGIEYSALLSRSASFQIAPFDLKAAIECSDLLKLAFTNKEKASVTKTKFKFDWQIIAIAASRSAEAIYAEDDDIERYALRAKIKFIRPSTLIFHESGGQFNLDLTAKLPVMSAQVPLSVVPKPVSQPASPATPTET
jgi:predicted nucleic acid-binding protein